MKDSDKKERALNMINSKLIFANIKLEGIRKEIVKGSKISKSILKRMHDAQKNECLTLEYIIEKI